jgi:hypothetical protein
MNRKGTVLIILVLFGQIAFSQNKEKQIIFDSLIVNTWKCEKIKIDGEYTVLEKEQLESRMIFQKNHTVINKTAGESETAKWKINAEKMTLTASFGEKFGAPPLEFKILRLEKNKLVLEVVPENGHHVAVLELIPE